jgi:ketosteroid isomerase-like protein
MVATTPRPYVAAMTTTTSSAASDVATVRGLFEAFGQGDLAGFAARLRPDATWHHRNDDRLGGVHRGRDGITAFLAESGRLTGGTLAAVPEAIMADGAGRVAVLVRISGRRPDGRTFDVPQILLCAVEGNHVRTIDQFVGDPPAVSAFWA